MSKKYEKLLPNILYQNDTAAKNDNVMQNLLVQCALPFATYFSCSLSLSNVLLLLHNIYIFFVRKIERMNCRRI